MLHSGMLLAPSVACSELTRVFTVWGAGRTDMRLSLLGSWWWAALMVGLSTCPASWLQLVQLSIAVPAQ